ncbi:uncharacterized protein LOC110369479 [Xyrichtys novacula]|uniref:Uncharacterized protein LOC110369479 n=1 Tax=Xyrichtys novacula TaxID=13765 RepID=A0AAV1F9P5_XYRNO|nr:uncharacterized protein LOC110369479 [Xyrichtys novacula]
MEEPTHHPWEKFIDFYFSIGLTYKDIKSVLARRHGFDISERHLKRILRARGLSRRNGYCDLAVLVEFISNELQYSGQLHGIVRGDLGTENGYVRDFQRFLVPIHPDGTVDSYLEGASTANQRIEYWWGFLRNQCVEFWMSLFADIRDNGFFDGGFLDKAILQFCCMGLIQMNIFSCAKMNVFFAGRYHAIQTCTNYATS